MPNLATNTPSSDGGRIEQRRETAGPRERTVLIVDDHRSFAEALGIAIDAEVGLRCVAIAETAADGLAAALRWRPEVVLVDLHLPDGHGHALVARLHEGYPGLHVLALTAYVDAETVAASAQLGICAFLRKECSIHELITAIRNAGPGPMVLDARTLGEMLRRTTPPTSGTDAGGVHLTPREHEVLVLLAAAHDARAIARALGVSIHTVRGYVKALLAKLDAHTQLGAVVRARHLGLLAEPTRGGPRDATYRDDDHLRMAVGTRG